MNHLTRRIVQKAEYALVRMVMAAFAALPRTAALRAGAALGDLFYCLAVPLRQTGLLNLAIAFPERSEAEHRDILRRSCRNLGRMVAEICHFSTLTPETIESYVQVEDREVWARGLEVAKQNGAILLTGHFGNWELFAYAHGLLGYPITLIHRPMNNPLVEEVVTSLRTRAGTRALAKKSAAKEAIRALRRQEMVVVPADQNQRRAYGIFVEFFGKLASTTPGPARLSILTDAPVYPVFLVRQKETDQHRVVILPPIERPSTGDREADILAMTQRCTHAIESMVRQHPDHWFWFHKRWKTRPEGEPRLYL